MEIWQGYAFIGVAFCECVSVGLLKKLWMEFNEILGRDQELYLEQAIIIGKQP